MNVRAEIRLRDIRSWDASSWITMSRRLLILIVGLFLFALSIVLGLQSNLGASSWTVLHDGLSLHTPLTIGEATELTGLLMLLVSWVVGIRPGIGTVLNMILVGVFTDIILGSGLIDKAGPYPLRFAMLVGAIVVIGIASGMYISSGLGAGPRDSFMLALTEITGLSVHINRWMIEFVVIVFGIILGGSFGIGTIIMVVLNGPAVGIGFRLFGLPTRSSGSRSAGKRVKELSPTDSE
ncbi:MAG TPA: membrane protein [Nitrolancea sp.]|nr:membrane protein [Nitrolancea sp.]